MPDDPRFFTTGLNITVQRQVFTGRGHNRRRHRFTHCMELVVGGNLLNQPFAVILKQDKIADIIEQ